MGPTTGDIQAKAESLADELIGTPQSMPDWVEEDDQEAEILEAFDQLAFECSSCGWWCEIGEANEGPIGDGDVCNDCHEEED